MRLRQILLAGVLVSLVAAGPAAALEVGQKAPDFTLAGVGGKQVKLAHPGFHRNLNQGNPRH